MADNSWITTAGEAKIVNALSTTTPFNITKWKIGDTANVPLNQALTDVVGTVVDNGTTAELGFNIVSDDHIQIVVTLDESMGPYDIGNVGLFSDDDTLIALATFETARTKTPNAVGVVGNRFNLNISMQFVDVQGAINFNILNTTTASWPVVQTIADLPDANLSSFENYIVREEPTQNRAITAIRNEEPALSGNFVWTLDYHNKLVSDPNTENNKIEINNTTGEQLFKVGGESQLSIIDGELVVLNDSLLELNSTLDGNLKLAFDGDVDTGLGHPVANNLTFLTAGSERVRITSSGTGFGETNPLGKVHIRNADSGASVSGNANELVLENSTNTGMSILSGVNGFGIIYFADSDDSDRGGILYDHGDDELRFRVSALDRLQITGSALQLLNGTSFQFDNGSVGFPAVASASDPNTGIYFSGADELLFATNGTERIKISNSRVHVSTNDLLIGNETGDQSLITSTGSIELTNSTDSFIDFKNLYTDDYDGRILYASVANEFIYDIITGGEHKIQVNSLDRLVISESLIFGNVTSNYDFRVNGTNRLVVSASQTICDTTTEHLHKINGADRATINNSGLDVTGTTSSTVGFKSNDGTSGNVAYGFTSDATNDTGVYSPAANQVGVSAGGAIGVQVRNTQNDFGNSSIPTNILGSVVNIPGTVDISNVWGTVQLSGNINALDGPMDYTVPAGSVMVGLFSTHDNTAEDRVWRVYYRALNLGGTP